MEELNRYNCNQIRTDELQQQARFDQATNVQISASGAADGYGEESTERVTSPPMSTYSEMLDGSDELGFDPALENTGTPYRAGLAPPVTLMDAMELADLKLSEPKRSAELLTRRAVAIKPVTPAIPILQSQSSWSSEDDDDLSFTGSSTSSSTTDNSVINKPYEEDRGFRKKSREKMRRHEVNGKLEVLVDLLGFTNRVRKKVILHETVSAIKSLKRECNELRRDRDRLQQQVINLAAYLQYAQLQVGSEHGMHGNTDNFTTT